MYQLKVETITSQYQSSVTDKDLSSCYSKDI